MLSACATQRTAEKKLLHTTGPQTRPVPQCATCPGQECDWGKPEDNYRKNGSFRMADARRAHATPSLLDGLELGQHVGHVGIRLDLLLAVAELAGQLRAILLDLLLEVRQLGLCLGGEFLLPPM